MKNYLILKDFCRKVYFVGLGDFWYEDGEFRKDESILYTFYKFTLLFTYGAITVLEIMAAVIGNFPDDEKSDSTTFAVSHTIVMIKLFSVARNKELVKNLCRDMISVCEPHEDEQLMSEKYRIMKTNVLTYFIVVYSTATCFVFEGLRKMHEGFHFVTIVTYYPSFSDDSVEATVFRISTTVILYMMMLTMIVSVDCFTVVFLIVYKYKFITLRRYFEKLRRDFDEMNKQGNSRLAAEKLVNGFIEGIVMHKELLRLSGEIDKAFGTVMTAQLCQSSGSAVCLLLQISLSDQLTFIAGMKIIFFVVGLFFLLGLFLCNAGGITYQASLLSDSIFYCGWHACPAQQPRRDVRRLVMFAIAQAQRPLIMKAFKMIELTYATFLSVVRGTYSVFALFYAQQS